ncbi:hypothetical protein [Brachymonas sp.]|uniref:hypothetical protein n=1 Tax=Brachymonas sp. TaxID=1936292 RepID=UPI0035AFFF54
MSDQPIHIIGRVIAPPEVRIAIEPGTLRSIPVLRLKLNVEGQDKPVHVEQEFCFADAQGAEAAARRYATGSLLKIDVDMQQLQLTFRQVQHIHFLERPASTASELQHG